MDCLRLENFVVFLFHAYSAQFIHRGPTQSVCVADSYFKVNVLELQFASPIAIYC